MTAEGWPDRQRRNLEADAIDFRDDRDERGRLVPVIPQVITGYRAAHRIDHREGANGGGYYGQRPSSRTTPSMSDGPSSGSVTW